MPRRRCSPGATTRSADSSTLPEGSTRSSSGTPSSSCRTTGRRRCATSRRLGDRLRHEPETLVTASNRAAHVYRLGDRAPSARALAERLDAEPSAEVVLFREDGTAVARREGVELRLDLAHDGTLLDGDPAVLDQPDAATRVLAALRCPNAGDVIVSAAEGWEFADLGGGHHRGGGSHGSLVAGDSLVPIVTVGLAADLPRSVVDVAPLVLVPFRRGRAAVRPSTGRMTSVRPADGERRRVRMVDAQLRRRGIADERVLEAMARVPREEFVPPALAERAYDDAALPIGEGQTISQPFIVAAMCELLGLDGSEHVLDVGTGSGYAAAVLDELAASVVSIERVAGAGRAGAPGAGAHRARGGRRCASGTGRKARPSERHSTRSRSLPRPTACRLPCSTSLLSAAGWFCRGDDPADSASCASFAPSKGRSRRPRSHAVSSRSCPTNGLCPQQRPLPSPA